MADPSTTVNDSGLAQRKRPSGQSLVGACTTPGDAPAPSIASIDPLMLTRLRPDWSAAEPLSRMQKAAILLICLAVIALSVWRPMPVARGFVAVATVFYLVVVCHKLRLIAASIGSQANIHIAPEALQAPRAQWPVYSILVPMYREPETVAHMVRALQAMDYPADRLDVQFLLEADDQPTLDAFDRLSLPQGFRRTIAPPSFPRTKPKVCNIGLALARGTYLVIYDAEDRPEPDQLKKAVLAFDAMPPEVACLQSHLNYYNPRQNLLTRLFTAEYAAWFDMALPGLSAVQTVIPLGGTSNHFVTQVLRDLLGWDAYNVTEDCDLGVRLYRAGYRTRMLETTTWEEACSSLPFWIRQRTRWIKGYIQTYFVHMRRPLRLLLDLGPRNFGHYQLLIGGVVVSFLLNPLFWTLAGIWFVWRPTMLTALFPGVIFALGTLCLFIGNFVFLYLNLVACYRRGWDRLLWPNLLTPFYWVLMSISGWRAFLQFFSNPFYWEKTRHGLTKKRK